MCLLLAVSLSAFGCGRRESSERQPVVGRVLFDGQPLARGTLRLVGGGLEAFAPIEAGRFALSAAEGPAAGSNRVEVRSMVGGGFPLDDPEAAWSAGPRQAPRELLPARYNEYSRLLIDVPVGGRDDVLLELSSRP
jgi:hypothetical protein